MFRVAEERNKKRHVDMRGYSSKREEASVTMITMHALLAIASLSLNAEIRMTKRRMVC